MIYNLLLALYFFPRYLFERFFSHKRRSFLWQRLGVFAYPPLKKREKPLIWIHAVSVGETKAAKPFLHQLRERFPNGTIIVSSTTETGHEEAQKSLTEATMHLFLPFDFSFSVKRVLQAFPIDLLFFVETDLWYNLIRHAKKRGAKIFLISAKMSKRSSSRYRWSSFYSKRLFSYFDCICCQNEDFKKRFLHAGAPLDKLCVTGNLKFDLPPNPISEKEREKWRTKFTTSTQDRFVTIASTHATEEEGILSSLSLFLQMHPETKIFLAPRHPERCPQVARFLEQNGFSYTYLSSLEPNKQIILIDCLGFLSICYALSSLAIVGGSFVDKIGGHNIFEPVSYGVPVFFGPYMSAQEEMAKYVLEHLCGHQVALQEINASLTRYVTEKKWADELSKNCIHLLKKNHYARETLQTIEPYF